MARKLALIIANSEYIDLLFTRLVTPARDAQDLADVLRASEIGGFDEVFTLVNKTAPVIRRAIAVLFANKKPDDLLLLYFSGHGVRDDHGLLYLAALDTEHDLLDATAVPANFITEGMNRSRSRRQVLILDCCHSGAFAQGAKGVPGLSVGTGAAFEGTGFGRVVLTASDATQYAWEGDQVVGQPQNSIFTRYLVEGLRTGLADTDSDGRITLDEWYDYVFEQVARATPKQTPGKWTYKQHGEIEIARNPVPVTKSVKLSPELDDAIRDRRPWVREGAVRELERLLKGSHPGWALAARESLERFAEHDDSGMVKAAAAAALAAYLEAPAAMEATEKEQEGERREAMERARLVAEAGAARLVQEIEETERQAPDRAEQQRLEAQMAEAARKAKEVAERLAQERADQERAEAQRLQPEQHERQAQDRAEAKRRERERADQERSLQKKAEDGRLEGEMAEAERKAERAPERLGAQTLEARGDTLQGDQGNPQEKSGNKTIDEARRKFPDKRLSGLLVGVLGSAVIGLCILLGKIVLDAQMGAGLQATADFSTMAPLATLAAGLTEASGLIAFSSDRDGNYEIYLMNADGSGQTRLTNNSANDYIPAWSPDGSQIAFYSDRDGDYEIYLMNADGSAQIRLTNNDVDDLRPAWSPDGSQIAFYSNRDGNFEIYLMTADGSVKTRLTNNSANDYDPAWSPNGSQIAFMSERDGNYQIYLMNANGSAQTRLTIDNNNDYSPAWSPNGRQIAFSSLRDGNEDIYVMNADGSAQTRLTTHYDRDTSPEWSRNGNQIAFGSHRDGTDAIYVMNADGSAQTRLTNTTETNSWPAWQK